MIDVFSQLDKPSRDRLNEIAKELSVYGMGIFTPHAHDSAGRKICLADEFISFERGGNVTFVSRESVPSDAEAVGWRWAKGELQVCAGCCGNQG